jgi:hypothetical protein
LIKTAVAKVQEHQETMKLGAVVPQVQDVISNIHAFDNANFENFLSDEELIKFTETKNQVTEYMGKNCKTEPWQPVKFNFGRYTEIGKILNAENVQKDRLPNGGKFSTTGMNDGGK